MLRRVRWHCESPFGSFTRTGVRTWSSSSVRAKNVRTSLPLSPARTRFAPSPTGLLHLGSLRTALFNFLLAKKTGGKFLLRIEDTDQKRTVPGAEARLCEDLQWAGLQWDEGPGVGGSRGPYRQSERIQLYRDHVHRLVESGHAYRCFCTAERLDDLARRRNELGLPTDYDRQCQGLSKGESDERASNGEKHVIRLLAPAVYPDFVDLVYGRVGKGKGANVGVTYKHGEVAYEDPILLKTDGNPTYHLANVVDDHEMAITHVVRATEWISSTPKHLAMYKAFGWDPPQYAHVGLLVDEHGHKLSKRNADTDVGAYRDKLGILPSAMLNFVALLGWSHTKRSDIMDLQNLIDEFDMKFTKGNSTVTFEKLWYLQRAHAARAAHTRSPELDAIVKLVCGHARDGLKIMSSLSAKPLDDYVHELVLSDAKGYETPERFCERNRYFFEEPQWQPYENDRPDLAPTFVLRNAVELLMSRPSNAWNSEVLAADIKFITRRLAREGQNGDQSADTEENASTDSSLSKSREKSISRILYDYIRWVLLAGSEGPSLTATMAILGREVCQKRLEQCAGSETGDAES